MHNATKTIMTIIHNAARACVQGWAEQSQKAERNGWEA